MDVVKYLRRKETNSHPELPQNNFAARKHQRQEQLCSVLSRLFSGRL
jgi:hypothetical protein